MPERPSAVGVPEGRRRRRKGPRPTGGWAAKFAYEPDKDYSAAAFQVPVDEYVKRFRVRETYAVPGGGRAPADFAGLFLVPVEQSVRWKPQRIDGMRDLRAFQGSALGQQKRALESGEWFDTDRMTVGGQGPSAMRLMDDEFIPIMGGPFHKQLYLHDYLLMHAREPRAAPWGQGSTSRRTRTPARSA